MLKLSSYIFILGITSLEAMGAPSCTNVSSSDKSTKKVNLISEMSPIKDQDSIGWCYGFAAADLLTHYLYKTKGRDVQGNTGWADYRVKSANVSAMALATMYNQNTRSDYSKSLNNKSLQELKSSKKKVVAEGGTLPGALFIAKYKGFCFERDVSSEDFSYVEDYRCAIKNRCNIGEILEIIYNGPKEKISCNDLFTIQKVFPGLKIQNIKNILVTSAKQDALSNLVNLSCKKKFTNKFRSSQPHYEHKSIQIGSPSNELMEFLDNHLNRGIPVGIMYYADFLTGRSGNASAHASSIVGKAYNPATCEVEYILKNSWGRGCGYYVKENPNYKKCTLELKKEKNSIVYFNKLTACRKNNKPIPRNPKVRCDESTGYVHITKSDLKNKIYNVTAIQEDRIL